LWKFEISAKEGGKLAGLKLKADFTYNLGSPGLTPANRFVVDIYDKASGQNIIDMIIADALADISHHRFPSVVTQVYRYSDFYIQKIDPVSAKLLENLQFDIQEMLVGSRLKPVVRPELNKLCVALFIEDGQYYRAKIIGFSNNNSEIEVFFIDYGLWTFQMEI